MRRNGILMHISSLPSLYGIGSLGSSAYDFVDFLHEGGQSIWQVLPTNPTSYGDSPYQSFSAFAGNPYFIDLDILYENGLISKEIINLSKYTKNYDAVDYAWVYENRKTVFLEAYKNFDFTLADYIEFCSNNKAWLDSYALFMALKDSHLGSAWYEWEDKYKFKEADAITAFESENKHTVDMYKMEQYLFHIQWKKLRKYANEKGIKIIGDMPIYTAYDSADVWENPHLFKLDKNLCPTHVAGCPPDAFSLDGQRWGNPLYDWSVMKKDNYSWFSSRMSNMKKLFDIIRIDHFRGFAEYYSIPAEHESAKNGKWLKGPGISLFRCIRENCGETEIIAEDLGFLTPSVKKLLKDCAFPGIKVLQFAFDAREESDYLPHNYEKNCVVYTGTHDNDTVLGWFATADSSDTEYAKKYLHLSKEEGYNWGMIRGAMQSPADTCILQMQDLLGLDNRARMNTPSTLGGNWSWRIRSECINSWLSEILYKLTKTYCRLPDTSKIED